jgi:hypothetical protein
MQAKVTVSARLKVGESGYQIITEEVILPGNKLLSLDQLFEIFKRRLEPKYKDFEYIVSLKVIQQQQDDIKFSQLPVEKRASTG